MYRFEWYFSLCYRSRKFLEEVFQFLHRPQTLFSSTTDNLPLVKFNIFHLWLPRRPKVTVRNTVKMKYEAWCVKKNITCWYNSESVKQPLKAVYFCPHGPKCPYCSWRNTYLCYYANSFHISINASEKQVSFSKIGPFFQAEAPEAFSNHNVPTNPGHPWYQWLCHVQRVRFTGTQYIFHLHRPHVLQTTYLKQTACQSERFRVPADLQLVQFIRGYNCCLCPLPHAHILRFIKTIIYYKREEFPSIQRVSGSCWFSCSL